MIAILCAIIFTCIIFLMIRFLYFILGNLFSKCFKAKSIEPDTVYIFISIAIFIMYLLSLMIGIRVTDILFELKDVEWYLLICMIGISCILWCYFEWSISHLKTKPKWTSDKNLKVKRAIVFFLIFIFILSLGFQQTLSILYKKQVDPLVSIFNYTSITAAIAFDRFMNQIFKPQSKKC